MKLMEDFVETSTEYSIQEAIDKICEYAQDTISKKHPDARNIKFNFKILSTEGIQYSNNREDLTYKLTWQYPMYKIWAEISDIKINE